MFLMQYEQHELEFGPPEPELQQTDIFLGALYAFT